MKHTIALISIILSLPVFSQTINITETAGWLESAYIKWQAIDSAESYNVYYSGEGLTDKQIDKQLIREYASYIRADILGLSAGTYTFKIEPVFANGAGQKTETENIAVMAHDRSGFAFSNGRVPGAYKADGTPKSGAIVLYITENTKNKISLNVTGANSNPCVGLQTILEGFKKGNDNRPLILRLIGQITDLDYMLSGDIVIENKNNASSYITFEGVGNDAVADGWGIRIKNASNIEIRNIGIMNCNSGEGDNIGLQQNNDYIWVHNVDFFYGNAGSDADQAKGDGALDSKKSTYVTHSYNHFWDSGKSNLLGNGGETVGFFTYHHNWYDHSDSRHPRVREHTVHVYNNYFDGIAKYGVGGTTAASIFVENNYFRNCKYPMLISEQGSDVFGSNDGTFSSDPGGMIKAYGNYIEGANRFVNQNDFPADFDAYVVVNKTDTVPSSIVTVSGGHTYNNFDTDAAMYEYFLESPEEAKTTVIEYAGRMHGGDFQWTFNNSTDDASYVVDSEFKSALSEYKTNLISVQGDSTALGNTDPGTDPGTDPVDPIDPVDPVEGDEIHNFTLSGLNNTFYTISGNLSKSKGSVDYDGKTLTQCLKIESSTIITFSLEKEAELTLVFNEGFSGDIKIDGSSKAISSGTLTLTLQAGNHEITKDDVANLYFMFVEYSVPGTNNFETISKNIGIQMYPNPVKEALTIHVNANINKINIYNHSGFLIKTIHVNFNTIETSELDTGIYFVSVYTDLGIFNNKLFKE